MTAKGLLQRLETSVLFGNGIKGRTGYACTRFLWGHDNGTCADLEGQLCVIKACTFRGDGEVPLPSRLKLLHRIPQEGGMKWDDPLPMDIQDTFQSWIDEVDTIPQISLPRNYFSNVETKMAEIHIFSDASQKAYGCVAYLEKGIMMTYFKFVMLKSAHLAPFKRS
ncbi:uncharacterized protein TNIN_152641 [Trichonephila inaurata madagascariensis]|uniref:Uncharacterized protein n=1 Tax=Trichonephila inaurata madagascariensis TaxID=2747483 RepID=A0A8X6KL69_9ARAC|nr:uncharacterized protein TNIN_152641 [Trichonephila inaurata madagascariensis]